MSARLIMPMTLALTMVCLLVVQCTVAHSWKPWGLQLELLPALLLYAAFTLSTPTALLLGVVAALMYDSFSAGPFGGSIIPYILGTVTFCALRPVFFRNRISTQFLSGFVISFIVIVVQWAFSGKFPMAWEHILEWAARLSIMSGVLAVCYFALLDFIFHLFGLNPGGFEEGLS